MMTIIKTIYYVSMGLLLNFSSAYALSPKASLGNPKEFSKNVVRDVFDLKNHAYIRYISKNYVEHIDGKVYNFHQWVEHMNAVKRTLKSYRLTFNSIVCEDKHIALSYDINAIKKDGNPLSIHILAIFKIKNGKIIYGDELTHVTGNSINYVK